MRWLNSVIKNIYTGSDNQNLLYARIINTIVQFFYCGLEYYAVVIHHQIFVPKDFALGVVAIAGLFAGHEYFSPGTPEPCKTEFPDSRVP